MEHQPRSAFRRSTLLIAAALAAATLPLSACAPKGLKATKIDVEAARITNHKCSGYFVAAANMAITREAPPPPPRRHFNLPVAGAATTGTFNNVAAVTDASYRSDTLASSIAVNGTQTDTCQPGTFRVTFRPSEGPAPTPSPLGVTVPSLGYAVPGGIPPTAGRPKDFTVTFDLKNCAAAPNAFTVTAAAAGNVVADPAVAPAMPLNIPAGATRQVTVTGSKVDESESGHYVVRVSAPGTIQCADQGLVE